MRSLLQILSLLSALSILSALPAAAQFTLLAGQVTPSGTAPGDGSRLLSARAGFALPTRIGSSTVTHALRYRVLRTDVDGPRRSRLDSPQHYHEIRYDVAAQIPAFGGTLTLYASPAIASDFQARLAMADVDLRTAVIYQSDGRWGLGVTYRNRLDLPIAPVLQFKTDPRNRIHIDIRAPSRANLWLGNPNKVRMGLAANYGTASFHIDHEMQRLDHTLATIAPVAQFPVSRIASAEFKVGYTLKNTLEWGTGDDERQIDAGRGLFVRLALVAR
ncbi:MAG: hypothetical protein JJ896_17755 [Rhodothermales bacterium]|nr:hypothetical protein [Rhodothermales bacterium]MBO6781508.1 hypothetical protein [Rhodothermales bacterium]